MLRHRDGIDMIYPHDNETQTRWDRGELQVQILVPHNSKPIGFCDGTDADLAEILARAEEEDAGEVRVERRLLKTGRQIWTVHAEGAGEDAEGEEVFEEEAAFDDAADASDD